MRRLSMMISVALRPAEEKWKRLREVHQQSIDLESVKETSLCWELDVVSASFSTKKRPSLPNPQLIILAKEEDLINLVREKHMMPS